MTVDEIEEKQAETRAAAGTDLAGASIEEQIIRMATLNYDRLPMLEVIFDRYSLSLGGALKSYTAAATEVELRDFSYMTCTEALDSLKAPMFIAVGHTVLWEGPLVLAVEPELLFAALEIMLGGRSAVPNDWTPRNFTAIERRLGQQLCEVTLNELTEAFAQLAEVPLAIGYVENSAQSIVLGPPSNPCVRVTLDVKFEGRGGAITYIIPYNTLDPIRPILMQPFLGGKLGGDDSWRAELDQKLKTATVTLNAVLHELEQPMSKVLAWEPGQLLDLGIFTDHEVCVTCGGRPMFRAAMGRRANQSVALRITEEFTPKEEAKDDGAFD